MNICPFFSQAFKPKVSSFFAAYATSRAGKDTVQIEKVLWEQVPSSINQKARDRGVKSSITRAGRCFSPSPYSSWRKVVSQGWHCVVNRCVS